MEEQSGALCRLDLMHSLAAIGARRDPAIFEALAAAYRSPGRYYHGERHVTECLARFAELRPMAEHPGEIEVALWFHDAVYDTRRDDNEARSAAWAASFLRAAGAGRQTVDRVAHLVLATRSHDADGIDAEIMLDVDLAILGAPAEAFEAYDAAIRREYAWVGDAEFRRRRAQILRGFLDRPAIYRTPPFHARYEARARGNLARKVAELGAGTY